MLRDTPSHRSIRLFAATGGAVAVSLMLGPDKLGFQSYALSMSIIVLLGGWVLNQTDEIGLVGRIASGALGLLLLVPTMIAQAGMVAEALSEMHSTSPHTTIARLPYIAVSVVQTTGPLMAGAGIALLILRGRMSGPVAGAILGGATAAWAGGTLAHELERAIATERFDDLVILSQGLRFVGLLTVVGALAGTVLAQQRRATLVLQRIEALRRQKIAQLIEERQLKKNDKTEDQEDPHPATTEDETDNDGLELTHETNKHLEVVNQTLYATPLFSSLTDEELEAIAPSFKRVLLEPGSSLFREGDSDASMFIVRRGEIEIWKSDAQMQRHVLIRMTAGMLFGEMAVVETRSRSANATANSEVDLVSLPAVAFAEICETHPHIGAKIQSALLKLISQRLRATSTELYGAPQQSDTKSDEAESAGIPQQHRPVELQEIAGLITSIPVFREMAPIDYDALAPILKQVLFEPGEHLILAGNVEPSMYLIASGQLEIWNQQPGQPKFSLAMVSAGSSIGEMALFEDAPRSANVTATTPVVALIVTRNALNRLTGVRPGVAVKFNRAILETLSMRLRSTSARLVDSNTKQDPSSDRVADAQEGETKEQEIDDNDAVMESSEADEEIEDDPIVMEIAPEEVDPDAHLSNMQRTIHRRTASGLAVLATLTAYWTSSPPWLSLIRNLPSPVTSLDVPHAEPGLPNAQRPITPIGRDFAGTLTDQGLTHSHNPLWPCLQDAHARKNGYGSRPRKTETFAVPADTLMTDLTGAIHDMRKRGVYRLGLSGQATPPYGALGSFLAWPSVQLLVDRPPRTVQWIKVQSRSLKKLPLLPGSNAPTSCALVIDETVTVDNLYATVRSLNSVYGDPSCRQAVVLVLPDDGHTTNPHPGWKGCP
jgi:CRP/FNR family cyclic AMP-dependent transcriptional regulator